MDSDAALRDAMTPASASPRSLVTKGVTVAARVIGAITANDAAGGTHDEGVTVAARAFGAIAANDSARGTYDEGGRSGRSHNLRNRGKRRS